MSVKKFSMTIQTNKYEIRKDALYSIFKGTEDARFSLGKSIFLEALLGARSRCVVGRGRLHSVSQALLVGVCFLGYRSNCSCPLPQFTYKLASESLRLKSI